MTQHSDLAAALSLLASLTAQAQTVERLEATAGDTAAVPLCVSPDGRWIGGLSYAGGAAAPIRWSRTSRSVELLTDYTLSGAAFATIINDGSVFGWLGPIGAGAWTSTGFVPSAEEIESVGGVSPDGSIVLVRTLEDPERATWIYRDAAPFLELGTPWTFPWIQAAAISDDGRIAYANAQWTDPATGLWLEGPLRWTDGRFEFVDRAGFAACGLTASGPDGEVACGVGYRDFGGVSEPIAWFGEASPIVIGPVGHHAAAIAERGSLILTVSARASGLWTPQQGWRSATDYLITAGIDPDLASRIRLTGVSRDGSVFCGSLDESPSGAAPIRILLHPPCPADFDADGHLGVGDVTSFIACFEDMDPGFRSADLTLDGFVDVFDYLEFIDSFESGC